MLSHRGQAGGTASQTHMDIPIHNSSIGVSGHPYKAAPRTDAPRLRLSGAFALLPAGQALFDVAGDGAFERGVAADGVPVESGQEDALVAFGRADAAGADDLLVGDRRTEPAGGVHLPFDDGPRDE